ncbi:unnamed protein product [Caenorhabditis brenneri]
MAPPNTNHWTTHPEYIDLLNYLIQKAKDAKSPMNIRPLAKEFKEKSGAAQAVNCLITRIESVRTRILSFEHIDTKTKVKLMFALSATVDDSFMKRMKKDAIVEVDDKRRIILLKANDGSLELRGDHSRSAKKKTAWVESKGSLRSLITNYFEKKNDADAVPSNKEESEMWQLIEFVTEKCVHVDTPLNIRQMTKDFIQDFQLSVPLETIQSRIRRYGREIPTLEFLDALTKVKQLFCLSATVNSDYLEKLRKDAFVEIDNKNRIIHYTANDRSLELKGDHSRSAKQKTAKLESKGSLRSFITNYLKKKNDVDAVPSNKEEREMWNLIEFVTEKCVSVDTPLNICQLTKDFIQDFQLSVPFETIQYRIRKYGCEIQKMESLDTLTKVKQLFCVSASVDSDYLEKLRKVAVVEVDNRNRITKYTANDGSMTLRGRHSSSAKAQLAGIKRKKRKNTVKKHSNPGNDENEESQNEYSEGESDEYSSEEFGSEFDSDDENDFLDKPDQMNSSNEALDFDDETPIRNLSPSEMSINFDFDPPVERSHRSEETERSEDEENDFGITGNGSVKERYKRLSKRRHLDSEVSCNQANSSSSEVPMSTDSLPSKSAKKKKSAIQKKQASSSSNQSRSSSRSMRRSTRNSSFPPISTDSEEKMENQDAQKAVDFDNESLMRNGSSAEVSMNDDFDIDPPSERAPRPEETELREDEEKEHAPEITGNASVKTRCERLSKRRHLDSEFSYDLANSRTSATPRSTVSSSSKPAKQKKIAIEASNSSNQSTSSSRPIRRSIRRSPSPSTSTESAENMGNQDALDADGNLSEYPGPRIQAMDDYDYNRREDNLPESSPIDNRLEEPKPQATEEHNTNNEVQNADKRSETVAPEPKPKKESLTLQNNQNSTPQMNGNEFIPVESHIRFLESLIPMMHTLDTPTLEEDELRIEKTIEKFKEIGNEEEKIRMNEIRTSLMTCLLIVERSAKKEIVKREDTTSLDKFLTSFYQFLVALKMKELDSFVARVKHMMKELKVNDKKFPIKKVQLALQSIIEIIAP